MKQVLVPIDGLKDSQWALARAMERYRQEGARIHLLSVQAPLPVYVQRFVGHRELKQFHLENGLKELRPAMEALDREGVPYRYHVEVGQRAQTIARFAKEYHCNQIILADDGAHGFVSSLVLGSVTSQVRQLMADGADACEVVNA